MPESEAEPQKGAAFFSSVDSFHLGFVRIGCGRIGDRIRTLRGTLTLGREGRAASDAEPFVMLVWLCVMLHVYLALSLLGAFKAALLERVRGFSFWPMTNAQHDPALGETYLTATVPVAKLWNKHANSDHRRGPSATNPYHPERSRTTSERVTHDALASECCEAVHSDLQAYVAPGSRVRGRFGRMAR